MKASVVSLIALAGLASAANAQVVEYDVQTFVVNSWTAVDSASLLETHLYDGQTIDDIASWNGLTPGNVLNPGQSLLLRVSVNLPGHGQTFAGSGTLPLRAFGTATFDLAIGNASGTTDAGSAPINPALYSLGVTTEWEDLVENISDVPSPLDIIYGADFINRIVPAQVPGFTSPLNTEANPWIVDLVFTPSDYSPRTATWTLSDGRDVQVWAGTSSTGADWVDHFASIAGVSGEFTIVPAPASLALLGLGGLVAGRRRR